MNQTLSDLRQAQLFDAHPGRVRPPAEFAAALASATVAIRGGHHSTLAYILGVEVAEIDRLAGGPITL